MAEEAGLRPHGLPGFARGARLCAALLLSLLALPAAALAAADEEAGGAGGAAAAPQPKAPPVALEQDKVARGKKLYARFCISCHGDNGDGRGYSAKWLDPRPRDFTRGVFKCRSTPTGTLPQDADLLRTLKSGLYKTYMPGCEVLGDRNLEGLIEYVKTFSPRWQSEGPGPSLVVPPEPADTPESRSQGEVVWDKMSCASCHGPGGKGDGASVPTLADDWGNHIVPYDFTASERRKCGSDTVSLYRTIMTGLDGTPMPSYAGTLSPEDAWHLVHYLETLRTKASMAVSH